MEVLQLDVTDAESTKAAVESVLSKAGQIDLLVCNAGLPYALVTAVPLLLTFSMIITPLQSNQQTHGCLQASIYMDGLLSSTMNRFAGCSTSTILVPSGSFR